MKRRLSLGALLTALSSFSLATPIVDLYNTGEGFSAGAMDTHYALSIDNASSTYGYVSNNNHWPINPGPWVDNSFDSQWLTPGLNAEQSFDPTTNGTYTWTLMFDLSGFDANASSFTGRWAADNQGIARLNGLEISSIQGFRDWSSFESGGVSFLDGWNTLEFEVTNLAQIDGNPTGLRVEFLSSDTSAVPEPSTIALFSLSLFGLAARRKVSN